MTCNQNTYKSWDISGINANWYDSRPDWRWYLLIDPDQREIWLEHMNTQHHTIGHDVVTVDLYHYVVQEPTLAVVKAWIDGGKLEKCHESNTLYRECTIGLQVEILDAIHEYTDGTGCLIGASDLYADLSDIELHLLCMRPLSDTQDDLLSGYIVCHDLDDFIDDFVKDQRDNLDVADLTEKNEHSKARYMIARYLLDDTQLARYYYALWYTHEQDGGLKKDAYQARTNLEPTLYAKLEKAGLANIIKEL